MVRKAREVCAKGVFHLCVTWVSRRFLSISNVTRYLSNEVIKPHDLGRS